MPPYSKVSRGIWGDEGFRGLSAPKPCGQWLWLFLLFNERMTSLPGLQAWGQLALAERLGWQPVQLRRAWGEIEKAGMAQADWSVGVISIPKAVEYDPPTSINVVKAWAKAYYCLPECQLARDHLAILRAFVQGMSKGYRVAYSEAFKEPSVMPSGIPDPVPDPRPEPTPEPTPNPDPDPTGCRGSDAPVSKPRQRSTKRKAPAVGLSNDQVMDLVAHHAAVFNRTWKLASRHPPIGDLRRRMAQAVQLVGVDGAEAGHVGHQLQCKTNDKRGQMLRHAYPQLEDGGKPASNKLDGPRYLEQVELGREHLAKAERRKAANKRLRRWRDDQVAVAQEQPELDPTTLPPWLREKVERQAERKED